MNGDDGDDTLVWNNGEGTDNMNGGDGTDTIENNGSDTGATANEVYTAETIPGGYKFSRTSAGPFDAVTSATPRATSTTCSAANDTFQPDPTPVSGIAITLNGGDGQRQPERHRRRRHVNGERGQRHARRLQGQRHDERRGQRRPHGLEPRRRLRRDGGRRRHRRRAGQRRRSPGALHRLRQRRARHGHPRHRGAVLPRHRHDRDARPQRAAAATTPSTSTTGSAR